MRGDSATEATAKALHHPAPIVNEGPGPLDDVDEVKPGVDYEEAGGEALFLILVEDPGKRNCEQLVGIYRCDEDSLLILLVPCDDVEAELITFKLCGLVFEEAEDDGNEFADVLVIAFSLEASSKENRGVQRIPYEIRFGGEEGTLFGDIWNGPPELRGYRRVGSLRRSSDLLPNLLVDDVALLAVVKALVGRTTEEGCVVVEGVDEKVQEVEWEGKGEMDARDLRDDRRAVDAVFHGELLPKFDGGGPIDRRAIVFHCLCVRMGRLAGSRWDFG